MNYASVRREDRPVAGAVPGSVSVVPREGAPLVRARGRESVQGAVILFPHRNIFLADFYDASGSQ